MKKISRWKWLYIGMLVCFGITRLWQLTTLPLGLHIDEAGMAYDAWSLSQYGVDRYLKSWPVYLTNFGGGQSSLYAFLCAILFRVFGYSVWLVRLPAVLFSMLTMVFGVKLARRMYPESLYLPLAAGGLVTICPYFILAGRFGLDCNLMLGLSAVFLYFLVSAVLTENNRYYLAAGLSGGLLLYTYALTYIVVPVFLILFLIYVIWTRRFSLKGWLFMAALLGILAFPLILVQCVNAFDLPEIKIGIFTITKLITYRASEIGKGRFVYFLQALISIFVGDEFGYNSAPGYYNIYAISIALFILGLCSLLGKWIISLKKREFSTSCIPMFWLVTMLFLGSHVVTNSNKMNGAFLVVVLFTVEGLWVLWQVKGMVSRVLLLCIGVVYMAGFLFFGYYYYGGSYAQENNPLEYFDITVPEAIAYIEENDNLSQRITYMAQQEIYYALSKQISPYEWQVTGQEDNRFGNFIFGGLGPVEKGCNYIVTYEFEDYCNELRAAGFKEIKYEYYSLFYEE